nr:uncharacterized protein LOC128686976 isoform X3 [Cherax quadricarinatus]
MVDVDKKYMPFWKWWIHKSESSPTLTHKSTKHTSTASSTVTHTSRHLMSSEQLFDRKRPIDKEIKSTEELFLRSLEDGHGVRSSEDLLERIDGDKTSSLQRYRRAVSTSHLSKRPTSLEQPGVVTSTGTHWSKSSSSLELKESQWRPVDVTDQNPSLQEDSSSKTKKSGKRRFTLPLGKHKNGDEQKSKRKEWRGKTSKKVRSSNAGVLSPGDDTVDSTSFIPGRKKHFDFGVDKEDLEKGKLPCPGYDILTPTEIYQKRSSQAKATKEGGNGEIASSQRSSPEQGKTSAPERDKSTSKEEMVGEISEPEAITTASRQNTLERQTRAEVEDCSKCEFSRTQIKPVLESRTEGVAEVKDTDVSENYDVPGPLRPIYEAPPPPRPVATDVASPKPSQDTSVMSRYSKEEEESSGMAKEAPSTPTIKGFPERPLPTPPSADREGGDKENVKLSGITPSGITPSGGTPSGGTSSGSNSKRHNVQRKHSEQPPTPKVVKKHQVVRRTKSEPRMRRSEFHPLNLALSKEESEAMQHVLDDHLFKHNFKVMAEAGVDVETFSHPHKPSIRRTSNVSTTSSLSSMLAPHVQHNNKQQSSSVVRNQQVSPLSGLSQEANDPRTKLTYDPQLSRTRSSSMRSKPAPPVRSPSTKLTTASRQDSNSSQSSISSKLSTAGSTLVNNPSRTQPGPQEQDMQRSSSFTSGSPCQDPSGQEIHPYAAAMTNCQTFQPIFPYQGPSLKSSQIQQSLTSTQSYTSPPQQQWRPQEGWTLGQNAATLASGQEPTSKPPFPVPIPEAVGTDSKPRQWSLTLSDFTQSEQVMPPPPGNLNRQVKERVFRQYPVQRYLPHTGALERDVARLAVTDWVAHRLSQFPPEIQSLYIGHKWSYSRGRSRRGRQPVIREEHEDEVFHTFPPFEAHQPLKGKGYGYSPPSAVFDDDPGIMSEAETSSTGFRRGGKQRASLPVSRTPSTKTLDSRNFEMDENSSYWDDDPGIMSEAETSSTGRGRNLKPRTSLPIVRTPSKTLERPLGEYINLAITIVMIISLFVQVHVQLIQTIADISDIILYRKMLVMLSISRKLGQFCPRMRPTPVH